MKVNIPLRKPEDVDFPEYPNKKQLNRWLWRIVQIPYPRGVNEVTEAGFPETGGGGL